MIEKKDQDLRNLENDFDISKQKFEEKEISYEKILKNKDEFIVECKNKIKK